MNKNRICAAYIACWGVYDPVSKTERPWTAEDIDAGKLTDLILSFAELKEDSVSLNTEDISACFPQVDAIIKKFPNLRISVAIGGAAEGEAGFRKMVSDEQKLNAFVQNVRELLLENTNLCGIDLDWEYPGKNLVYGTEAWEKDFDGYLKLLKSLKLMMNALSCVTGNSYRLTTALPYGKEGLVSQVKRIQEVCDGINLMLYDYSNAKSSVTGHNTPVLRACSDVLNFINHGAEPSKLILGLPFYGQRWENVENLNENHGLGSPVTVLSDDLGFEYSKIIPLLSDKRYEKYTDGENGPFLYNPKEKVFISYTGPEEISTLTVFALKNKLGGVMTWEYGQDLTGTLLTFMSRGISGT